MVTSEHQERTLAEPSPLFGLLLVLAEIAARVEREQTPHDHGQANNDEPVPEAV